MAKHGLLSQAQGQAQPQPAGPPPPLPPVTATEQQPQQPQGQQPQGQPPQGQPPQGQPPQGQPPQGQPPQPPQGQGQPPQPGDFAAGVPDQGVGEGEPEGADIDGMLEEATPSEQKEYERAMGALYKILYEDNATSDSLIGQLTPKEKIGSVAKASMLLLTQLDEKLDLDEAIISQMTEEVVDRVIELGEANYGEEMLFSDRESQAALGATWEGVMEIFGVDEQDYQQLTAGMDQSQFDGFKKQYEGALNG